MAAMVVLVVTGVVSIYKVAATVTGPVPWMQQETLY